MKGLQPYLTLLAILSTPMSVANTLDDAHRIENNTNRASANSQDKIDASAEASLSMKAEIEQLEEEVKNLAVYRDHLARLVASQEQESDSLDAQIEGIKQTRQGIVPLMYNMIEGLQQSIAQDKPIKLANRQQRLAKLEQMMSRADVSDAEKYRRILEAYQIELDYGIKMGTYSATLALNEADTIEADMLYLGRVTLVARSLDGKRYWLWQDSFAKWQSLDSQYAAQIDKAFAIANKQVAPSLIQLPLSVVLEAK